MQTLFEELNTALTASAGFALLASFAWGVLSILLSPCHLASVPLVVGFIGGQGTITQTRALVLSSLFSLGILLTIAAIGVITVLAGRIAGDAGAWVYYLVAGVFLVVGFHLLDVIALPFTSIGTASSRRKGALAALLLGLLFGLALGPCTFAFMAPVLGVSFQSGAQRPLFATALLLVYGVGHCSVIVVAGSAGGWVQRYLHWNDRVGAIVWLRRLCGVLVILGGLWLIYTAPSG